MEQCTITSKNLQKVDEKAPELTLKTGAVASHLDLNQTRGQMHEWDEIDTDITCV